MTSKLNQYFSFAGRFCLNFVLAFIIMRMIYLYVESGSKGEDSSTTTAAFPMATSASKALARGVESKVSVRTRGHHINHPASVAKIGNTSSSPLRSDLR